MSDMAFFKLDKLGPRYGDADPNVLSVRIHAGASFDDAFQSAIEIVRLSQTEGISGFRLTNSAGNSRVWYLRDEDALGKDTLQSALPSN
jgi:hypothetical protein